MTQAMDGAVDEIPTISRAEIVRRRGDGRLIIVDVLPPASFQERHLPGARNLPAADITERAAAVLPDPHADIVTYCGSHACPRGRQAASVLRDMGYTGVRYYPGGLEDWEQGGGRFESGPGVPAPGLEDAARGVSPEFVRAPSGPARRRWSDIVVDTLGNRPIAWLLGLWFWMIAAFGLLYWGAGAFVSQGLRVRDTMVGGGLDGFLTALYFSFVTALSIGYGDVVPEGWFRLLAILEGAAGLILFGAVISKLVSRRQEELTAEIHLIAYEDRLDRVRTNLHLVLTDLQAIVSDCEEPQPSHERILIRLESTTAVFAGELQTVHDLLYRPQQMPDEDELESILASLAANLRELSDCVSCLNPPFVRSPRLTAALGTVATRAAEICGECVPREYAPQLREWMDRIQEFARRLA